MQGKYTEERLNYVERREQKRRHRQLNYGKHLWRFIAGASICWGIGKIFHAPVWYLYSLDQVQIEGEQILSEASLRSKVNLPFPQHIIRNDPQAIVTQLEAHTPVHNVRVARYLFPTRLVIYVQERVPVAKAIVAGKTGLIDAEGIWMPSSQFPAKINPPALVVNGFNPDVAPYWPSFYQLIATSPIKIRQVSWLDKNNMILSTELGNVHCGAFDGQIFAQQLTLLDRMRQLPTKFSPATFAYLDLKDTSSPVAVLHTAPQP